MKTIVAPAPMSLFNLLQLLTLFVRKSGSHLAMRVGNDLMDPAAGVAPNVSQLSRCFVDDRRNFSHLFRGQIKFGAEPVFHSSADPLGMMQFKEMIPGI